VRSNEMDQQQQQPNLSELEEKRILAERSNIRSLIYSKEILDKIRKQVQHRHWLSDTTVDFALQFILPIVKGCANRDELWSRYKVAVFSSINFTSAYVRYTDMKEEIEEKKEDLEPDERKRRSQELVRRTRARLSPPKGYKMEELRLAVIPVFNPGHWSVMCIFGPGNNPDQLEAFHYDSIYELNNRQAKKCLRFFIRMGLIHRQTRYCSNDHHILKSDYVFNHGWECGYHLLTVAFFTVNRVVTADHPEETGRRIFQVRDKADPLSFAYLEHLYQRNVFDFWDDRNIFICCFELHCSKAEELLSQEKRKKRHRGNNNKTITEGEEEEEEEPRTKFQKLAQPGEFSPTAVTTLA
jgi:hypothetical protein